MSTDHIDGQPDAEVVLLRAKDAGTEVRTAEATGPAYTDLSDGRPARKPVVPAHWRSKDAAREHVKLAAARHGHAAAYHGVRVPGYLFMTSWWALVGIGRTLTALLAWWHVPDLTRLERQAAADGLLSDHLRIHKAGRDVRTTRGFILAACAAALVAAIGFLSFAPPWVWVVVAVATLPLLARAGRPAGKPIVTAATLPAAVQAPSQDVITRALGSLGIAGIDRWLRDGRPLVFPSPVREDGPGWRAEVDLPFGVTAAMVTERREQLASGLRRPLGAVWPEPVTHEHAGRLELWVGRQAVSKARQSPWPLLRGGQADVFQPIPFGTDVRGRTVKVSLIYHNWPLGSIPRQGKTAAVRARALREAAGTVTGHAAEDAGEGPRDVLTDVLSVFGSDAGLQWGDLAARLASRFPARWDGATADAISAECRAAGVPSVNVRSGGGQGKGCRREAVEAAAGAR
jgi:DNA segregation ATPase FtsK/SpoIIIE, S-DNA-T family